MAETDWREILSFSQRELKQADKEKLCETLSWMEADDIELNFTDLKILFRLSQDILKYKNEQVNNLLGQVDLLQRTKGKAKSKRAESPPGSSNSPLETVAHQKEVIKANKNILEQLYAEIAELEERKSKLESDKNNAEMDSESSRATLSEINAIMQLENEITVKNKHIRKLLSDVKVLEEENSELKEKITVLKDKLSEATKLIDNFTEQLTTMNNECTHLKDILGKTEQSKSQLVYEIEALRIKLQEKDSNKYNSYEDIKLKIHHWKNIARAKKAEVEALNTENIKLKEIIAQMNKPVSPKIKKDTSSGETSTKIMELQDKLLEASKEIEQSANLIHALRLENKQLRNVLDDLTEQSADVKNESDDGKEQTLINKLKRQIRNLTTSLQGAEEMISVREKELTEISSELQNMQSDGVKTLIDGLKSKKQQLKIKDEGIKNMVKEINALSQEVNDLQLQNETLRRKFNVAPDEKISSNGILKHYHDIEQQNLIMTNEIKKLENKLVYLEMKNRSMSAKLTKLAKVNNELKPDNIMSEIPSSKENNENMPVDGGGESSTILEKQKDIDLIPRVKDQHDDNELQSMIIENECLRKGLQEILNFLKDNSTTSSGILSLQCPSLETLLRSMEARHTAGWYAPHMTTVMELREALGGKNALLEALHESRKETYQLMTQLSSETKKSSVLEKQLQDIKTENKKNDEQNGSNNTAIVPEIGSWMSENEIKNIDVNDNNQIENIISKGEIIYDTQLKKTLEHFYDKFRVLYEKMTSMFVQSIDNYNQWSIKEEQYKTEIQNLKSQLQDDDDISDISPGIVPFPNICVLERKCKYLEESYKYIRTLNENIKNENFESKRELIIVSFEYETQIQKLILNVTDLTNKLRNSISLDLFWKQNKALNEVVLKYRQLLENNVNKKIDTLDFLKHLENDKIQIISRFQEQFNERNNLSNDDKNKIVVELQNSILQNQLKQISSELELSVNKVIQLEQNNKELQELQAKIIDENLAAMTKEDVDLVKNQLKKMTEENKILKDQCHHVESQLEIALLQLQNYQQQHMNSDMELNILRHQILDLQSTGNNKAILTRLSNEVLVTHLQVSESQKNIESLTSDLNKEKELRIKTEDILKNRQKMFEVYAFRYETKFKYMYEVMQCLRHQYQGCLPLSSIERHIDKMEDLTRKTHAVDQNLSEIEHLQSSLIVKNTIFDQILDVSRNKCLIDEDSCPHKMKCVVMQATHSRELDHLLQKLKSSELARDELIKQSNNLEKSLVLLNQAFGKTVPSIETNNIHKKEVNESNIEIEDIPSDDESSSRENGTITLTKPKILKPIPSDKVIRMTSPETNSQKTNNMHNDTIVNFVQKHQKPNVASVLIQTTSFELETSNKHVQTDEDKIINELKLYTNCLKNDNDKKTKELREVMALVRVRTEENLKLNSEKNNLESNIQILQESNICKNNNNEKLRIINENLKKQIDDWKNAQFTEQNMVRDVMSEENKSLLLALKQLESDKNDLAAEYKQLLNKEREEYSKNVKNLQAKILELQTQLDKRSSDGNTIHDDTIKESISKYTMNITELKNKCFQLQNELDECKNEVTTFQSECDRWKNLAYERLHKLEQINSQFEERHSHEVESYKAENQHWLSQLNETQKEHSELRSRLTEQKTLYLKQLADKDAHIEQLRYIVNGLKTQIINMQTMLSVNDPSFDLSAIVEVDESNDTLSQQGSDKLELKFESTIDLNEIQGDIMTIPGSSTTIWQETIIERLRRDKQLASKQNTILRRQIKALAARERRSRLDAQNLKNQIFRISTSGSKVATAETAALQNKIASLQAQLTSARRDTQTNVALWDKWKRAQQASERWQARYEEKCQEVNKQEASLTLAKSAVVRLEREKRVLLSRIAEIKNENQLAIEKQDEEPLEKSHRSITETNLSGRETTSPTISTQALLDRIQAQQRRIVALELAEKGNEHLVSEYEKSLAEITSLKGQVLKLESTLLESQIKTPLKATVSDSQPELDYWKSYCEMLKEENVQLTIKINSLDTAPTTAHQHRVNDLEQTVLTLRGLVSKLQADQKTSNIYKKADSRPSSGRSNTEKNRSQLESYRLEIANLKRTIHDKDLLLEKSKEMLKIAAEREDELLRENSLLRRRLDDLTSPKEGFLSA